MRRARSSQICFGSFTVHWRLPPVSAASRRRAPDKGSRSPAHGRAAPHQRVLRLVQRLLRLQHGDEVDGAFAQALFGDIEGAPRARQPPRVAGVRARAVWRCVRARSRRRRSRRSRPCDRSAAIRPGGPSAVRDCRSSGRLENRLRQAGGDVVEHRLRPQQRLQRRALVAALAGERDGRQELRARALPRWRRPRRAAPRPRGCRAVAPAVRTAGPASRAEWRSALSVPPRIVTRSGERAISTASAFLYCARVCSSGGIAARCVSTTLSCCAVSSAEAVPACDALRGSGRARACALARFCRATRSRSCAASTWK